MDEGLAKAAKVQKAKEDVAKVLAKKTLGTQRLSSGLMFVSHLVFGLLFLFQDK